MMSQLSGSKLRASSQLGRPRTLTGELDQGVAKEPGFLGPS